MKSDSLAVIYWDTSALLSALFRDVHSEDALRHSRVPGTHLMSSLAWAETHAVMARIERDRMLAPALVDAAREALEHGPWRRINAGPSWTRVRAMARSWPLRGADLWHLATTKDLQSDLPEIALLSFDAKLNVAASGEGLECDIIPPGAGPIASLEV